MRLDALEIEKFDCWGKEKRDVEDRNFQAGFDFYLLGFIANDPDYDWEKKFGKESAKDVAEFKVVNAEKIRKKRIELGLEEASKDAPSSENASLNPEQTEDQDVQSSLNPANPNQTSIPQQVVPDTENVSATQGASLPENQGVPWGYYFYTLSKLYFGL